MRNNNLLGFSSLLEKNIIHEKLAINLNHLMAFFLLGFTLIYTLIPSFFYQSVLPDSAQNLSWGHTFAWSYNRHPPLGTWLISLLRFVCINNEVAAFSASVLCLSVSLFFIFLMGKRYLTIQDAFAACLLSSLSIYYFANFVLQFNQNSIMLPFWVMIGYYSDRCLQSNKMSDWILLGIAAAGAILAKYESLVIIFIALLYLLRHFEYKFLPKLILASVITLLLITPHLISVAQHGFLTLEFIHSKAREGQDHTAFYTHLFYPLKAFAEQSGHLLPALALLGFLVFKKQLNASRCKFSRNYLVYLGIAPLILVVGLSLAFGLKIQPEWGFPLFAFTLPAIMFFFQLKAKEALLKPILLLVLGIHTLALSAYMTINYFSPKFKRTNNPSYFLAHEAQRYWNRFSSEPVRYVAGNEHYDYYLAAYLPSHPLLLEEFSITLSPWISKADLEKSGLLIILDGCDKYQIELLKKEYPIEAHQCLETPLSNKYQKIFKPFALMVVPPARSHYH